MHSTPARTGIFAMIAAEPADHIGRRPIDAAASAVSMPFGQEQTAERGFVEVEACNSR